MVSFEIINNDRISFGYTTHQFKTYKKHCNKMKRFYKNNDKDLHLAYSLEANLAKFKLLNSLPHLYKNIRLLKKNEKTADNQVYERYINAFIQSKKNDVDINNVVDLRNKLADFYAFLDDIYLICDNRHDFEQYKTKYQWNDINLVFETQKILASFLNRTFPFRDFRFNTQLALKILEVENHLDLACKNTKIAIETFKYFKDLQNSIINLVRFLSDNFVESEFVLRLKSDCEMVLSYVKQILDYQNGDVSVNLDNFKFPAFFKNIENDLKLMYKNRKIDLEKISSILLNTVETRLKVNENTRKMPFLPVFYDIAYDFIDYPKSDEVFIKQVQNLDILNKN